MTDLNRLQRRHRLEEVASRFGVHLLELGDALALPFTELTDIRVEGRLLDAGEARARAEAVGLVCDDRAIGLALDGSPSIEDLEDRLLTFFGRLVEGAPQRFLGRPKDALNIPASGELPESAAWLERFYGGDFLPREKKSAVVDLARCQGPFLRSVDRQPLQIIDSASQIASLAGGFRPDAVQAALDDGRMDEHLVDAHCEIAPDLALLDFAWPGIKHVAYTNGGAEAVEKSLHLARRYGGGGRRVVAFTGSFHGRTLLSLYSTWNPVKREPYQLAGYETEFVEFPVTDQPGDDPPCPAGWRQAWSDKEGTREWGADNIGPASETALAGETAALLAVEAQLRAGDVMAVIIEPYQCEGGDRAATPRFFHALRALTRAWGIALIFDEVQAGFGLGGAFFWHRHFWLTDAAGQPDGPDLIVCAKRAQTGIVLSRWPDAFPTTVHSASRLRGQIHREIVHPGLSLTDYVAEKLTALAADFPEGLITRGRATGDAFAFDLPTKAVANKLIAQRFYRGMMVYIAGEKTLRYRLNQAMETRHVDLILGSIREAVAALIQWAGEGSADTLFERMAEVDVPAWAPRPTHSEAPWTPGLTAVTMDRSGVQADGVLKSLGQLSDADRAACCLIAGLAPDARGPDAAAALSGVDRQALQTQTGIDLVHFAADLMGTRIRRIPAADIDAWIPAVTALENDAYEPARRDAISYLRTVGELDGGIMLVAQDANGMVGMSFAGPLELWWGVDGPRQDPNMGKGNTLYSADITVAARARGRGIGRRLRQLQLSAALRERTADKTPRYAFVTGRNRMGAADAMWAINRKLGAYTVREYTDQYGERSGRSRYYRIPLRRWDRRAFANDEGVHPLLARARSLGVFDDPSLTKLTVSNFITAGFARYAETMRAMAPRGTNHLYFTSCLDEMSDKAIRVLKHKRTAGQQVVSFDGAYFGHTTAASRSLTDWSAFYGADPDAMRQPPGEGYFPWPRVASASELDAVVAEHGAEAILGVFVESVQARTGQVLSQDEWSALCEFRDRTGIPLVLSETCTGGYRSGNGAWWLDGMTGDPDMVLWWHGGQIGHIFTNDATWVSKPLAFISTWDGDELSATRNLWQLWAASEANVADAGRRLAEGVEKAGYPRPEGAGLYQILKASEREIDTIVDRLERWGVPVAWTERVGGQRLILKPPVWSSNDDLDRIVQAMREARR